MRHSTSGIPVCDIIRRSTYRSAPTEIIASCMELYILIAFFVQIMSKNYTLEILPDESKSLATFRVRDTPSFFMGYVRLPLIGLLFALLVPQTYGFWTELLPLWKVGRLLASSFEPYRLLPWFLEVALMVLLLLLQHPHDSIMVIKDMGVQLSSTLRWRLGSNSTEFIPLSDIIDIVVHEGFHGFGEVIFYMCVLTKASSGSSVEGNGIKIVFPQFLPRKDILLQVWRQSREMLYGKRRHFRHVPGLGLREVHQH